MKITIVTTMRNEGAHLLEWIAHHRAAGVNRFVIYTNDCDDHTNTLLDLLPGVHVIRQEPGEKPPQWRALKAAWDHPTVVDADWVACIDCDEFINLGAGLRDISELIDRAGGDAILLPWRLFGSAGHIHFSQDRTTRRFTRAAPEDMLYPAIGSYFKTLFRRAGPFQKFGVHRPKQKNAERHGVPDIRDGSGHPLTGAILGNDAQIMNWGAPVARDLVQLNHYSLRSASDFMLKRHRGLPNHQTKPIDLTYWVERNFNAVDDNTIAPMQAATETVLAEFMALDGVREAYDASRHWAEETLATLLRDEASLKLFGRLQLAGNSAVLDRDAAMELINAYRGLDA